MLVCEIHASTGRDGWIIPFNSLLKKSESLTSGVSALDSSLILSRTAMHIDTNNSYSIGDLNHHAAIGTCTVYVSCPRNSFFLEFILAICA